MKAVVPNNPILRHFTLQIFGKRRNISLFYFCTLAIKFCFTRVRTVIIIGISMLHMCIHKVKYSLVCIACIPHEVVSLPSPVLMFYFILKLHYCNFNIYYYCFQLLLFFIIISRIVYLKPKKFLKTNDLLWPQLPASLLQFTHYTYKSLSSISMQWLNYILFK